MSGAENLQCVPGREFLVRWRIKNFSVFGVKEDQREKSATFEVPFLGNTQWFLKLIFKQTEKNNIMCFLCRNDVGPEYVKVYYSISVGSSYVVELQTFARNCFSSGLFNQGNFNEEVFCSQSKDVLQVECRLWPDTSSEVPTRISPYPVGIEMVTTVPKEIRNIFYKIPNFSNFPEGQAIEFCVDSAESYGPVLICRLWVEQQTVRVLVREAKNNLPIQFVLKCNVHLLDAFRDQHFLYHGSTVINNCRNISTIEACSYVYGTMNFPLALSKKQLLEKKDLYLPGDELLLHWEFAFSFNIGITNFVERTLYDEPSDLQVKRKLKWGIYLERKYNEHRFFFRLLAFLVVFLSVLPHLLFDNTP